MAKQVLVPDEKGRNFARAVRAGQFLYVSGMTGQWNLTTWERDPKSVGDVAYQTRRIFEWAQQVLGKCGLTLRDVVSTTTFLRSMQDLDAVSRVKREFFPGGDVASTTVAALDFVGTGDIEINFVALFPEGK
jgi:enamine deaminase RidA (YjgF/YER057c/UK114 family)